MHMHGVADLKKAPSRGAFLLQLLKLPGEVGERFVGFCHVEANLLRQIITHARRVSEASDCRSGNGGTAFALLFHPVSNHIPFVHFTDFV